MFPAFARGRRATAGAPLGGTTPRIPLVLAAADPAQPYGAALPWPRRAGARAARVAGAHVVLLGGEAALYVERGGRTLVPLRDPDEAWLRPALGALGSHGSSRWPCQASRWSSRSYGRPVIETEAMPLLLESRLPRRPPSGGAEGLILRYRR